MKKTLATIAAATATAAATFPLALTAALAAATADNPKSPIQNPKSPTPNIIFILADDLGWTDLACQGSKYYETPNIDRLAAQGMRFTNAYTMPNCAPTRACLQTGKYSPRTGIYTVGSSNRGNTADRKLEAPKNNTTLSTDIPTLPELLRGSGYTTGLFGKWHLGTDEAHSPLARGYDYAVRYDGANGHIHFITQPAVAHPQNQYLADFLADRALEFLDRAASQNKPFLLLVTHFDVHEPLQAPQNMIDHFTPKPPAGGHHNPTYAAMIKEVDDSVGRILKKLDDLHLANNTLVIFTSDNGGVIHHPVTDNTPLRGGKGMHYEGGYREPYIVRWPGVTKPGATCDTPIHAIDLVPTVLDLTRHPAPPGTILDGKSYVPLLKGQRDPALENRTLYWHCPVYLEWGSGKNPKPGTPTWRSTPGAMIRQGPWKLIEHYEDNSIELYNLTTDLSEKNDLSKQDPQRAAAMLADLHQWRASLNAPMPTPNPDYQNPNANDGKNKKGKDKKAKKTKKGEEGEDLEE